MKPKSQFHGVRGMLLAVSCLLLVVSPESAWAQPTQDFGDAPSPYPTLANQNGARHTVTGPQLGATRDAEFDGQPNSFAQGDDNNGDDEDGVTFTSLIVPGQAAVVLVNVSGAPNGARLDAWIDFDINGSWVETTDRIFSFRFVTNGLNTLVFAVPAAAKVGATFARFRISAAGDLNFIGSAANGEVEDYRVVIGEAMDFGDAPTNNYATLLTQNAARHSVIPNFMLGTRIDSEPDGQPNASATGDDINPTAADDEDGVTFTSALVAGSNGTVQVVCTMAAGVVGKLNAWLDFNRDGDWGEANEQILTDVTVGPGTVSLSFPIPGSAAGGATYARFRLNANGKIGPNGSTSEGEVEDYLVNLTAALDYGDAPTGTQTNNYPTLLSQNGARHVYTNTFCLGQTVDGETDGQPDLDAKGDDVNPAGASDDEDGVNFTSSIVPGQSASLEVYLTGAPGAAGPAGVLNGWLDFNRDGDWNDAGEQILTNRSLVPGINAFTFLVPAAAVEGATYARFRLNRQGGLTPAGLATDGEVEDYRVNISPDFDFGDAPAPYPTTLKDNGARHSVNRSIHLGQYEDSEPDGQPNNSAIGDDINPSFPDDEDGVFFVGPVIQGEIATVQVVASVQGLLYAWVDFNINGSWADAGERIFNGLGVNPGTNTLTFLVPAGAQTGRTMSRFRFTTLTSLVDFTGHVGNGEVEDHILTIITDRERCDHNCEGKSYWLTFPGNYAPDPDNPARLSLCLMGPAGTAANVSVPGIGFSTNVVIPAAQALNVPVPRAAELGDVVDAVTNIGIRVIASAPISITAFNHARYTTDSYMALNTSVIGTKYIVQGFGNTQTGVPPLNGTQFALVATESNTLVAIRPSVNAASRTAGVPYLLVLQPGDAYQLRSTNDAPADLSSTLIVSDKPIAVFGGHQIANVASSDLWFCDYIVEQLLPVNTWGNDFYTAPLATRTGGDTFRLLASQNNTTIFINGVAQPVLNLGQFHQRTLAIGSRIIADKPILVTQYANSGDYDGNTNADPFMLTVPATRHFASAYRICTPTNDFPTNFVHVIVPSASVNTIAVDGVLVGAGAFTAIGGTAYSFARVSVTPGRHFVTGGVPFSLSVYGWAEYDSYGHPACMYFGDVVSPTVNPSTTGATANVNDYPNSPGFVPSPNFASATTIQDNCDSEIRVPEQEPKPGTLVPPGVHTITLRIADYDGNIGETNVTFTVLDPSPVTIQCPSNIVVNCQSNNGAIVNFSVSAFSLYDTNVPVVSTPASGSFFPSGTTVVTNVGTSLAGQSNTCTFTVTILCDRRIRAVSDSQGLTLTWDGLATVQFATNPAGPWSNVISGVSRYSAPLTGKQGFFRVQY